MIRLGRLSKESVQTREVVSPTPNPQAGGPPLVSCPQLLIQYIRSYPLYLEGVSSIRNLRKQERAH
jgi:hypothetical protein